MPSSFYESLDASTFQPTPHTMGPWDARFQHGGPPAALLGRAVESAPGGEDKMVTRIVLDILRPVPLTPLELSTDVPRPGKKVDLVTASLSSEGVVVMTASAWRMRTTTLDLPGPAEEPPVPPSEGTPLEVFPPPDENSEDYYLRAMEIVGVSGSFWEPGPAAAWFRPRYPLLPDEEISPLGRTLIAVDSASGISAEFDPGKMLYINTDLAVHLHRYPKGEWVLVDARSTLEPHGTGMCAARILDESGPFGRSAQSLLLEHR